MSRGLSKLERRRSVHHDEKDKVWRGSVIDLSKWTSDDDVSVFSDASDHTSDDAADVPSHSAAHVSELTELQNTEDPQDQVCSAQCPPTAGSIDISSLNLCHKCAGINFESLTSELGYEHRLLSELPSHDQLHYLNDWDKGVSTGLCQLCLVFRSGFLEQDLIRVERDKYWLFIKLEGIDREEIHDQDHFDEFHVHFTGEKVKERGRSMSRLFLGLMHVRDVEDYPGPGLEIYTRGFSSYQRLHCFTDMDDPGVPFGAVPVRPVGNSTLSAASFEVAAAWLSQCLAADPPEATVLPLERVFRFPEDSLWRADEFKVEFDDASAPDGVFHLYKPERPARLLEIGSGPESHLVRLVGISIWNNYYGLFL